MSDTPASKMYSRAAMRVRYTIPAELTDQVGLFLLKIEILDISPLAARIYCSKPSLLNVGQRLTLSLWNNTRTRTQENRFALEVTVMAKRGEFEFVLLFDRPMSPETSGLEEFVYGPILLEALLGNLDRPVQTLDELKRASDQMFGPLTEQPLEAAVETRQHLKATAYLFRTFLAGRPSAVRAALSLRVCATD
ncbi:MAG TPA: hypothetical protein V6D05_01950 [Stenomitos sp.]